MLNGILLIDKPSGPTSHDIVNRVRRIYGIKKVGHLGTLDPLASGLLIIALGNATKTAQHLVKSEKEYLFTMKLGFQSETDDAEMETKFADSLPDNIENRIKEILPNFIGEIEQEPPKYSAVKHKGLPLYKWARQGVTINSEPRRVFVQSLKITKINLPSVEMIMKCSSGTYVRSICRDIGKNLGCGAIAESIRRTMSGIYSVSNATNLDLLTNYSQEQKNAVIIQINPA